MNISRFPFWMLIEHFCKGCGRKVKTSEEVCFLLSCNECISCDHVRGSL